MRAKESGVNETQTATEFDYAEFLSIWLPDDPWQPDDPNGLLYAPHPVLEAYYRSKYEIAKALQPRSILEIGVRAGYSAWCFLKACPGARYFGMDLDQGTAGGERGLAEKAAVLLDTDYDSADDDEYKCVGPRRVVVMDSLQFFGAVNRYDFWHIDGDHSFVGTLSDLLLARRSGAKWILLDDYQNPDTGPIPMPDVDMAARAFFAQFKDEYDAKVTPGPIWGQLLLTRKEV